MATTTTTLNNTGVDRMKVGDLSSALNFLRRALNSAVAEINQMTPVVPSNSTVPRFSVAQQVTALPFATSCDFLHAIGIYLMPSPCYVNMDELQKASIQSSIILYNLGVLFHLRSCAGGDKASEGCLDKAVSRYQRSQAILDNMGLHPGRYIGGPAILVILGMATLNNLGCCLFQQGNYHASQQCLSLLEYWLLQQQPYLYCLVEDLNSLTLLEWNRSTFLLNVLTLRAPTRAAAA